MHSFSAMNTQISTYGLSDTASKKIESMFHFTEGKLSRFLRDSELSQLNRSGGNPFLASDFLFQILNTANEFYHKTDGIFNPYIGKTMCEIGYDRSFEKISIEQRISGQTIATPKAPHPVSIDTRMKSIMLTEGVEVDLGGIAKGWAAQQISELLRSKRVTRGVIDAGGDLAIWGGTDRAWEVNIVHPNDPTLNIFEFSVGMDVGIATSSTIKRRWLNENGATVHHIIDPRTLKNGDSDFIQVTVLAPNLTIAEVYAKCLLILGSVQGKVWIEQKAPDLAYLGVKGNGSVVMGGEIENYCKEGVVIHG
ncbi:FAD:protein FMN transferase [Bacillus sp. T3]|uniref:FAD:protein FMN transferase n=1 Tax=Bacillus sp. T3 TaxID=467262 RepID=UPI002980DBAA|nr:FAD:protein FMN transferase [Bacillus sp. T3]